MVLMSQVTVGRCNMKPKKKSAPPKGKIIPDSKPENSYKKAAKAGVKARAAGKRK